MRRPAVTSVGELQTVRYDRGDLTPRLSILERPAVAPERGASGAKRVAAALAGPLLISAAVLLVLHGFLFGGRISAQHVDPLSQALPSLCLQRAALLSGHLPLWNPYAMGGAPFAADPQSGWLSLPAMGLSWALPCGLALRVLVVLLPLLAGLGAYAFLRGEGVSRPGATAAGLMLSLGIAASDLTLSFPFAGAIAWTMLTLAAAGRLLRAGTGSRRLVWLGATGLAWGQIAAAHLSQGLVIGTMVVLSYLVGRSWIDAREGRRTARESALLIAATVATVPLLNLALLLPRIAYIPHTSFGLGYPGLEAAAAHIAGKPARAAGIGTATSPPWPLKFATTPGTYLGAVGLALSLAWWRSRRGRPLAVALAACGAASYLLSLRVVASALQPVVRHLPRGDVYLHSPWRFRFGVLMVVPLLAGLGFEAWRSAPPRRYRALALAPGVLAWWLLPVAFAGPPRLVVLAVGAVVGGALLLTRSPRVVAPIVASALAIELVAGALIGQGWSSPYVDTGIEPPAATVPLTPLLAPTLSLRDYLHSDAIVEAARARTPGRVLAFDPPDRRRDGYQDLLPDPASWPLLGNQRAQLFGLEDAEGYNPLQSVRYWRFVRTINRGTRIRYNAATFARLSAVALDLLQVTSVVAPGALQPRFWGPAVAHEGRWALYQVPDPAPRASVLSSWTVVGDQEAALRAVTAEGFDPSAGVVLEQDPGVSPWGGSSSVGGRATYVQLDPNLARVDVSAPTPSVVLVRNVYDPGWRATVDGRPARVMPADSLMQAVAVPAGTHTILLTYHDPPVGYGLLGSGVAIAVLLSAALGLAVRDRRRRRSAPAFGDRRWRRPGAVTPDQRPDGQKGESAGGPGPAVNVVTR